MPVSPGHALSAHSLSSSLKRCRKQAIPKEVLQRRTTNSPSEIPDNTGSALGSLDITRNLEQHSQPERNRLFDKKKGGRGDEKRRKTKKIKNECNQNTIFFKRRLHF